MRNYTAVAALLISAAAHAQTNSAWQTVGAPAFSEWATICSRIASDANGNVYVAYQDLTPGLGARVTVKKRVGDTWQLAGAQGAGSIGAGYYCNMAFDASGALLVASRDYGLLARAGVRRYDPASNTWSSFGVNGMGPGEAHYVDLVQLHNGRSAVVYQDGGFGNRSTAMAFAAGVWSPLGAPGYSAAGAGFQRITAAPDGTIYTAYSDGSFPDASNIGKASVLRYDPTSSTWSYVGTPGFTPQGASNLTLTIDRTGVPWIAYYRYHDAIVVQRFDGTNWVTAGDSPCGADVPTIDSEEWRQWLSLQFDSQNRPYIAYQLYFNGRKACVRRLDGSEWLSVGQWGFTPGAADYLSMIVDAQDVPWVAYRDGANGQRVSVMRYVPVSESYCISTQNSVGCFATISSTGAPSLTGVTPFSIRAGNVINQSLGMLVYSSQSVAQPFGSGTLCVGNLRRAGTTNSGGAVGAPNCTGFLQYDFGAGLSSGLPGVWFGTTLYAQFWYRDSTSASGYALTNGLRFVVGQ
ncbi:MAG: hypothetical protein SGI72_12820 [Planctomycetota bacterium]|nr:hypothetical protein [Planctomycetota bacterium]